MKTEHALGHLLKKEFLIPAPVNVEAVFKLHAGHPMAEAKPRYTPMLPPKPSVAVDKK